MKGYVIADPTNERKVSPISALDNFLIKKSRDETIKISYYNLISGKQLNDLNDIQELFEDIITNATKKDYTTTDHLIYSVSVQDEPIEFVYISLDNSVRSNQNKHPLIDRLNYGKLLSVINAIYDNIVNEKCKFPVFFFSESCRPSFLIDGDLTISCSWLEIRNIIETNTRLKFVGESRNNNDSSDMSFGVSCFAGYDVHNFIETYYVVNLVPPSKTSFGSGCFGIKLKHSKKVLWAVHFPLDFKSKGKENNGAIAMRNLINDVMEKYPNSIIAFGDMNTIEGEIMNSIKAECCDSKYELFLDENCLTFFGSYFDMVEFPNATLPDEEKGNLVDMFNHPYCKESMINLLQHNEIR